MPVTKTRYQADLELAHGQPIEEIIRWAFEEAVRRTGEGHFTNAADILGIRRHTLAYWCAQYQIDYRRIVAEAILKVA